MSDVSREQSYGSHSHTPIHTVVAGVLAVTGLVLLTESWLRGSHTSEPGMILLALAVAVLVWIDRVYSTSLQNRIIRLEMRVRLIDLLGRDQHEKIQKLTTPQLVGLRFASDAELPALVDRAIAEKLSREDIKRAIKNWVPDWERT